MAKIVTASPEAVATIAVAVRAFARLAFTVPGA